MNFEKNFMQNIEKERNNRVKEVEIKKHLKDYLELEEGDLASLEVLQTEKLPAQYQEQLKFLNDQRLKDVQVVVVPDKLWHKGKQPSESHASRQMVLFNQKYFETQDDSAWACHEFAHCQKYLDQPDDYEKQMQTPAFPEIASEYNYPNNQVELFTFSKQFEFLKQKGLSRNEVMTMIAEQYDEEHFVFFNKVLDKIYT